MPGNIELNGSGHGDESLGKDSVAGPRSLHHQNEIDPAIVFNAALRFHHQDGVAGGAGAIETGATEIRPTIANNLASYIEMLGDTRDDVREAAAHALRGMQNPSDVAALCGTLREERWEVRYAGAGVLREIGAPAVPPLIELLRDKSANVREWAAEVLGRIKDPRAVPTLIEALKDDDFVVRGIAAAALGGIKDPRAVQALSETLQDKSAYVRNLAAVALGEIKDPSAVPALSVALTDSDESVGWTAAKSLGEIKDPSAVPALIEALKGCEYIRWQVAGALRRIGVAAMPALLAALMDEHRWVREGAAHALGEIQDRTAVPALCEALKDEEPDVRWAVARALGEIGDPLAIPALKDQLQKECSNSVFQKIAYAIELLEAR